MGPAPLLASAGSAPGTDASFTSTAASSVASTDTTWLATTASSGVASQLLELGVILLALGLIARFSKLIGMSAVPLFLLAGLFFGKGGSFDLGFSDPFVRVSAEIGALLLLLLLGVEYSARELVTTVREKKVAGALDVVLNAVPGAVAGLLLGWGAVGAITLAGVTYISSSGIVAQVMKDLRWRDNPESTTVVGLLVVEDLAMAPYLPILTAVVGGASVLAGLVSVATACIVVAVVLALALRPRGRIERLVDADHPVSLLLLVLGVTLVAAGLATFVGVSSAVAAFLVGLALSGQVAETARRQLSPLRDVFAALFFLFFGLSTDPSQIPSVALPAIALALVTIATKFALARYAVGTAHPGAWKRAGALLTSRGEFSVVIAGIATVSGALPAGLDALAATYVLITAIVGPVLARLLSSGTPDPAAVRT